MTLVEPERGENTGKRKADALVAEDHETLGSQRTLRQKLDATVYIETKKGGLSTALQLQWTAHRTGLNPTYRCSECCCVLQAFLCL